MAFIDTTALGLNQVEPADGFEDAFSNQRKLSSTTTSAGGVAFWGDAPDAYDSVVLAGFRLPGLCAVKGKGFELRRKQKRVVGKHGVSITNIANEPAEFVIHVMMTTKKHLEDFEKLVPIFKPSIKPGPDTKPNKSDALTHAFTGQASKAADGTTTLPTLIIRDKSLPEYLSVDHPLLALFRISHCRIMKVTIPEQHEDKGLWKSEIHCIEQVLEGNRKANTGKSAAASNIAGTKTAYDKVLGRNVPSPAKSNTDPPP